MNVQLIPVRGLPEIGPGARLGELIARATPELADGDVVVVTQKAVSKAEGRLLDPAAVVPSPFALTVAAQVGKDPREVEVILAESRRLVRMAPGVLIMESRHGFVCANAGVDRSNVPEGRLCLLPLDPDASARRIRRELRAAAGADVAVVISDTFGRAWRVGQTNVAIGVAGMRPLADYRGQTDALGRELRVTEIAVADELAAAAELVMHKTAGVPAAVVRGYPYPPGEGSIAELLRPAEQDLFR
jgi:coenzyme F420-0:L-glutamate ligase/coenzyme F420-1:gamma-L-glutamate ligase